MICVSVPPFTKADLSALMAQLGLKTPKEVDAHYGLPAGSTAKLIG